MLLLLLVCVNQGCMHVLFGPRGPYLRYVETAGNNNTIICLLRSIAQPLEPAGDIQQPFTELCAHCSNVCGQPPLYPFCLLKQTGCCAVPRALLI